MESTAKDRELTEPLTQDPNNIATLILDGCIKPGNHVVHNRENLVPQPLIPQTLSIMLRQEADNAIARSYREHMALLVAQGPQIVQQMFEDAYEKSSKHAKRNNADKALSEVLKCLPGILMPEKVEEFQYNAFLFPHVPAQVMKIFLRGMRGCMNSIQARLDINNCVWDDKVDKWTARMMPKLVQVALYQSGGMDEFAAMLRTNDNQVLLYHTSQLMDLLGEEKERFQALIKDAADGLLASAMSAANFRIF